jgi:uncharacterized RDD family membrane protein YckC
MLTASESSKTGLSVGQFRALVVCLVCLVLWLLPQQTFAQSAGYREGQMHALGLSSKAGGGLIISVHQPALKVGDEGISFIFTRTPAGDFSLKSSVAGEVVGMAEYQGQVLVWNSTGSWRILYQGDSSTGTPLPEDRRMVSAAALNDELYAIGSLRGQLRLYRLTGRQWTVVGDVPPAAQRTDESLAAVGTAGDVLYLAGVTDHTQVSLWRLQSDNTFEPMGDYRTPFPLRELEVHDLGNKPGIWASPKETAGGLVLIGSPRIDPPDALIDLGPIAGELAISGGRLRFFYKDKQGPTLEQVYELSGNKLGEPLEFRLPLWPVGVLLETVFQYLILGALGMAVVASIARRAPTRAAAERLLNNPEALPVAPLFPRMAAGAIDAAPYIAAMLIAGNTLSSDAGTTGVNPSLLNPQPLLWIIVASVVSVLITAVGEMLFGRSLGKFLFGLHVTNLEGNRPGLMPILVRNLLRLVDYTLFVPMVVVLFSPLRQRIGDSAAGTLVLMSAETEPDEPEPEDASGKPTSTPPPSDNPPDQTQK